MNRGFISWLILIIVALAALKYFFDWSIFDAAATEEGRGTINYIREVLNTTWFYIKTPLAFLWDKLLELIQTVSNRFL
jgi:hypothetical protein